MSNEELKGPGTDITRERLLGALDFGAFHPDLFELPAFAFQTQAGLSQGNLSAQTTSRTWDYELSKQAREKLIASSTFSTFQKNGVLEERHIKHLDAITEEWIKNLTNSKLNKKEVATHLEWLYAFCGKKAPSIVFATSPSNAQQMAQNLKGHYQGAPMPGSQPFTDGLITDGLMVPTRSMKSFRGGPEAGYAHHFSPPPGVPLIEMLKDHIRATASQIPGHSKLETHIIRKTGPRRWSFLLNRVTTTLKEESRGVMKTFMNRNSMSGHQFGSSFFYAEPSQNISIDLYPFMIAGQFLLQEGVPIGNREIIALFSRFKALLESGVWGMIQINQTCIIIPCPMEAHWNEEIQLHKDGGPALAWADGWKIHCLNDVTVPEYLAVKPATTLTLDEFHKESNADIRAEFIRKYGVDRMAHLGKLVDSYKNYKDLNPLWKDSEYELLDMGATLFGIRQGLSSSSSRTSFPGSIQQQPRAHYLKMKNLTVPGVYHLEGVSNNCTTIAEAVGDRWEEDPKNYESIAIK